LIKKEKKQLEKIYKNLKEDLKKKKIEYLMESKNNKNTYFDDQNVCSFII
jgi:hypothetical protein